MTTGGLALGYWATGTLRKQLGRRVDTWTSLQIVDTGAYALVRHPSYLASILIVIGLPLLMNAYVSLVLSAVLAGLFVYRLLREEDVLSQRIPAYAAYMQHTFRLVPWVW